MATIKLYGTFRRHVDAWQVDIDAPTVGEALRALTGDNPALREAIFGSDTDVNTGANDDVRPVMSEEDCETLRPFVRVIVNGRDTALGDCLDTPLRAGDEVSVFSPIAGGRSGESEVKG